MDSDDFEDPPVPTITICPICGIKIYFWYLFNLHLAYCRKQNADLDAMVVCPFSSMHELPASEMKLHLSKCPNRLDVSFFSSTEMVGDDLPPHMDSDYVTMADDPAHGGPPNATEPPAAAEQQNPQLENANMDILGYEFTGVAQESAWFSRGNCNGRDDEPMN